ncbi:MAG: Crp/Fnr family transcriptional regulator [Christensenellales bacterium]
MTQSIPLFAGISPDELDKMLACLSGKTRFYAKSEVILAMGEPTASLGLLVEGAVQIVREDIWGNRQVLQVIAAGDLFGESYACLPGEPLLVSAVAADPCQVLFLQVARVMTTCPASCPFHNRLARNLLTLLARKNLTLTRKIDHVSQRTIREKVLRYLGDQALLQGERSFEIPLNRQELADYLAVDRSALSAELSRMQGEGLIAYRRSRFTLL